MAENSNPNQERVGSDEEEINLLDLLIVLAKHKKMIGGLTLGAAIIALVVSLIMPNIYTATTKILPPQNQSATAALLAQLGPIAGVANAAPGIRNPNDLYIGMLKSRTVADNLIQKFDLNKLYEQKFQSDTRKKLERATQITAGKDGIITIEVDDKDPKRAAALANSYVDELFKLTNVLAVTMASQRRLFFERQFAQTRENLARAEMAARQALEKGGLANVDAQSRGILETTAKLRAQISAKEIELSAMRTFATGQNPDLMRGQEELIAMKGELAKIEGATGITGNARGSAATLGLDNVRLLREVKYNEALYELLAKQYELARIDEANDAGIVQVLDKAIEPDRKSKPKRTLIVILTALIAGFVAILWAFIKEANERARMNPEQAERWQTLKRYLWRYDASIRRPIE